MSDLIRREDATEVIYRALRMPAPDYRKDPFHDSMSLAVSMAKGIPSAHQWIPLSERWPDDDGVYLVTYKGVTKVALFAWGGWTIGTEDGIGQALPDAWMPLPNPYKGE